ncbi:hypothetical protein TNCV_2924101 [Trichonephila clavipes]|nr:hypothetical protein TNCV_2924101 [Trichonephila clavipes]
MQMYRVLYDDIPHSNTCETSNMDKETEHLQSQLDKVETSEKEIDLARKELDEIMDSNDGTPKVNIRKTMVMKSLIQKKI